MSTQTDVIRKALEKKLEQLERLLQSMQSQIDAVNKKGRKEN